MIGFVIGFIVLAIVLIAFGIILSRRGDRLVEERLGLVERAGEKKDVQTGPRKSPLGDMLNKALSGSGFGANLATQLARADLKVTVGEFLSAVLIIVLFVLGLVYWWRGDVVSVVIGGLLAVVAPFVFLRLRRGKRLKAFNEQLGDTINLLVNGIRAGYSIMQAMEAVSEEMGPPISEEFGRVVREVQLGLTMEQAMDNMLRRITSDDLDMMVTAINVQREVGGNLAEVLDSISHTIRERVRIQGEIRALTSYGRGAGNMLSAIPIILAGIVYLINPEFMTPLFTDPCGRTMVGVAVMGIGLGYFVISKIVQIDV